MCYPETMAKTRTEDNEMIGSAKSAIRTCRNMGIAVTAGAKLTDAIEASGSLFELADSLHLGRSATRAKLLKVISSCTNLIEQGKRKEAK